jgi:hypothetical protein
MANSYTRAVAVAMAKARKMRVVNRVGLARSLVKGGDRPMFGRNVCPGATKNASKIFPQAEEMSGEAGGYSEVVVCISSSGKGD